MVPQAAEAALSDLQAKLTQMEKGVGPSAETILAQLQVMRPKLEKETAEAIAADTERNKVASQVCQPPRDRASCRARRVRDACELLVDWWVGVCVRG
eukprot:SAG11_NODE_8951_length_959_cov_1.438372_1_plen_96_part_10